MWWGGSTSAIGYGDSIELGARIKYQQRQMWTLGDYAGFAQRLQSAADLLIPRIGIEAGDRVLDVATGTGNAAVLAAAAGARVSGLDLTPELFTAARRRAEAGGWEVDWVEGDAEHLPFEDGFFDRVVSVFGVMFAPDHERAAQELARVCRPGGTIGLCSWTPTGVFGQMVRLLIARQVAAPPPGFKPPGLWGVEEYASGLFDGLGLSFAYARETVVFEHESAAGWVAHLEQVFGPVMLARSALESDGQWAQLRAELVELYTSCNESEDGGFRVGAEYLVAIAVKRAQSG